jgi:hypothetical protein
MDNKLTLEEKIGKLRHYSIGVTDPEVWTRSSYGKFFAHSYYTSALENDASFELPDNEPRLEAIYGNVLEEVVDEALRVEEGLNH